MRISVAPIELGTVTLPDFHPRAADGTCPIRALPHVPVWVQRDEIAASEAPYYTVPEWASIEPERARIVDGDAGLAPGVTLLSTPGHTPGHQSVLVDTGTRRELIVGQACYLCSDFEHGDVTADNLHDESWAAAGAASIERLASMGVHAAHFSHDQRVYRPDAQGV